MRSIIASILLVTAAGAHAAIYKCETADGKTEFSDIPCGHAAVPYAVKVLPGLPANAPQVSLDAPAPPPPSPDTTVERAAVEPEPDDARPDYCPTKQQLRENVRMKEVSVCMTREQVKRAEYPRYNNKRIETIVQRGVRFETWFYALHPEEWPALIRFRDGVVIGYDGYDKH